MDSVKEAFLKVKQDIYSLQEELFFVKKDIDDLKGLMEDLINISKQSFKLQENKIIPTQNKNNPTSNIGDPTDKIIFNAQKAQNKPISIGNGGVPTDRQTNQQTNQQTNFKGNSYKEENASFLLNKKESLEERDPFIVAAGAIDSLDNLKKELRLKFKRLTEQEFLVFSTLYQLDEEKGHTNYKEISLKLSLTESSIRDYIGKLVKKGIPVDKIKINNKSIQLKVSTNLKKVTSLSTILLLREI